MVPGLHQIMHVKPNLKCTVLSRTASYPVSAPSFTQSQTKGWYAATNAATGMPSFRSGSPPPNHRNPASPPPPHPSVRSASARMRRDSTSGSARSARPTGDTPLCLKPVRRSDTWPCVRALVRSGKQARGKRQRAAPQALHVTVNSVCLAWSASQACTCRNHSRKATVLAHTLRCFL